MAACNVGGTTIHSFAGIGIGAESADQLIAKVRKNRAAAGKWTRSLVLVIDEGEFSLFLCASILTVRYQSRWSMASCLINSLPSRVRFANNPTLEEFKFVREFPCCWTVTDESDSSSSLETSSSSRQSRKESCQPSPLKRKPGNLVSITPSISLKFSDKRILVRYSLSRSRYLLTSYCTGFINMLNEMRFGTLSEESIARFKSLDKPLDSKDGIEYTEL